MLFRARTLLILVLSLLALAVGCAQGAGIDDDDDSGGTTSTSSGQTGSTSSSTSTGIGGGNTSTSSSSTSGESLGGQGGGGDDGDDGGGDVGGGGTDGGTGGSGGTLGGEVCTNPANLSNVAFPHQLTGTFTDLPTAGGSCDATPDNVVWFTYTAQTTGFHDITLSNQTTTMAYSRVAVFDGTGCNPLGSEVACATSESTSVTTLADLTQGSTYLIMFYTDGPTYTMVNPSVNVAQVTVAPGELCSTALDVSTATFPHQVTGTFGVDPATAGSCDTSPTNAVWFTYTPTATDWYEISLENFTTANAYSRLAVFAGAGCNPLGTELGCTTASAQTISQKLELTAGTTYLVVFHTDGDSYPMVNPQIDVHLTAPPPNGSLCAMPEDVSGASFPHQVTGTFDDDPTIGVSCDASPTNVVWYEYSPPATGSYTISAENQSTTLAYSRLAVLESTACGPYGAEVLCDTASGKTISAASVTLNQGTDYLILFFTDGESWTMVDPILTITP